jgi:DNA-binding beta-propeller fold protein YncE
MAEPLRKTNLPIQLLWPGGLLLFLLLFITTPAPVLASRGSSPPKITRRESHKLPLTSVRLPGGPTDEAILVSATDMSQFSPPSPDSSGIAYLPHFNSLLISDSEVDEIPPLFTGKNLFLTSLSGDLLDTLTTIPFADEPSGVAYNPANNHLFFTDDTGKRGVFEMNPGPDGAYDTADDMITYIDSTQFGSMDPEGIAFDSWQGHLFIVDGLGGEVYEINPGPNGIFDGIAPLGDDLVSHFDVNSLGIHDPEGIEFNPDNGHLYILASSGDLIAETKTDGALIRYIDFASLNILNPAGLAYAPASSDPTANHLYVVARGVDNSTDPDENDGMLYEITTKPVIFLPLLRLGQIN